MIAGLILFFTSLKHRNAVRLRKPWFRASNSNNNSNLVLLLIYETKNLIKFVYPANRDERQTIQLEMSLIKLMLEWLLLSLVTSVNFEYLKVFKQINHQQ